MFVYCTETCVGALVKNMNGSAPLSVWRWESGSLDPAPECVVGGFLTQPIGLARFRPGCLGSLGPSKGKGLPATASGPGEATSSKLSGPRFLSFLPVPKPKRARDERKVLGVRASRMVWTLKPPISSVGPTQ